MLLISNDNNKEVFEKQLQIQNTHVNITRVKQAFSLHLLMTNCKILILRKEMQLFNGR